MKVQNWWRKKSKLSKIVYKLCVMKEGTAERNPYLVTHKWPWVVAIIVVTPVPMLLIYICHWSRWCSFPIQWGFLLALIYARFRMAALSGVRASFNVQIPRWSILIAGKGIGIVVYKSERNEDGSGTCSCWPFRIPKHKIIAIAKVCLIRFAVNVGIIK